MEANIVIKVALLIILLIWILIGALYLATTYIHNPLLSLGVILTIVIAMLGVIMYYVVKKL